MSPKIVGICEFYDYQNDMGAAAANRLLFTWLSNDKKRATLYADMISKKCALHFESNVSNRDLTLRGSNGTDFDWGDGLRSYGQKGVLLAHPDHIEAALKNSDGKYSNSPYRGLGGFFMLSLDDVVQHDYQRDFAFKALRQIKPHQYDALATLAFKAGTLAGLRSEEFDLVGVAENIAVRYVTMVFGFAQKDLPLVQACTSKIGKGLHHQNMARHFVFDATIMPECRQAVVALGARATHLMQLYVSEGDEGPELTRTEKLEMEEVDEDLKRIQTYWSHRGYQPSTLYHHSQDLKNFTPLTKWAANFKEATRNGCAEFGLTEKGLLLAGLVGGAVTNIQNAICICMAQFLKEPPENRRALQDAAYTHYQTNRDAKLPKTGETDLLLDRVKEALRVNPPAAFIPRRATKDISLNPCSKPCCAHPSISAAIPKDALIILGLGGATWLRENGTPASASANQFRNPIKGGSLEKTLLPTDSESNAGCPFSKVFGGAPLIPQKSPPPPTPPDPPRTPLDDGSRWDYTHSCPGMMMSMNIIYYAVRQLLLLPGLSQKLDPVTGGVYGLEKYGGLQATYFPLVYQRERLLVQTPLQTVLPIRAPVDVYSQQLRQVLRWGAPFIEKVLSEANHVHFASFMFIENDSKLCLFTMYDGDFDAYIAHFAREFGHLFDRFFACMAVQPTMPIRENPFEFVQYLKQFVHPPVEGYYFSAYPEATAAQIRYVFDKRRKYDLNQFQRG